MLDTINGLCCCGCGQKTDNYKSIKNPLFGQPRKFIHGHGTRKPFDPNLTFWPKVDKKDCWEWTGSRSRLGYGSIKYSPAGFGGKNVSTHRLVWILTHGEIPHGLHVLHRCDNRACVNPEHLYLGDHAQNMKDRSERGRCNIPKGADSKRAKFTWAEVELIRSDKRPASVIARSYNVSVTTIKDIRRKRTYKSEF